MSEHVWPLRWRFETAPVAASASPSTTADYAVWTPSPYGGGWVRQTKEGRCQEPAQPCRRNQVTLPSVVGSAPHSSLM